MAKKDLSTLLTELKSDREIKISEYSKEDILNAAIYLANSKDLSMYNNDEISKEFYNCRPGVLPWHRHSHWQRIR